MTTTLDLYQHHHPGEMNMDTKNGKPRTETTTTVQLTRSEYRMLQAVRRKATTEAHLTPCEHRLVERMRRHRVKVLSMAGEFATYLEITKDPTAAAVLMLRDTMQLVARGQDMQIDELFDEVESLRMRR